MVLPWSQVVSAHVCISYCPDEYLRRTLCTRLQLRTVAACVPLHPGLCPASRCCRLPSFVSRLSGHCLSLLEVQCLETHRFIDCGVIFVVSGGRGNLVPDVPFWPEVEVCFLVFTSTSLSQKTCLVFPFSLSKFFATFARLYRQQVFGLNSKFDWFPRPLNLYPHCFPPIEVRVYRKGQFINQHTKPNTVVV